MDTQVADTLLGTLIDGRYRIRGRVARGGMATVYTAVDERLERVVALKIIHPSQADDGHFLERFTDEAKTIARLTHPNVVAVYDQGVHDGLPYLVMEYVRGQTLRELLQRRRRLGPGEALAILEQVLAAVAAAHRAGLVHRDVKPENVLVATAPSGGAANLVDSVVKVADFGLARAVEASADADGGQLMATVAYVAPELVTDARADARADVYSAGIVLYEMLTGEVPYDGDRAVDVAWQHVDRDVPPPSRLVPGLPRVIDDVVARATRRDPAARPTDAGALLAEVQAARDAVSAADAATQVMPQVAPSTARQPVLAPTEVVPALRPEQRPAWARLPDADGRGATRRPSPPPVRTGGGRSRLTADPRFRAVLLMVLVLLGFVAVGSGYWFAVGRYTDAPQLVNKTRAQAEAQAASDGYRLRFTAGRYDEEVAKDTVLAQDPPAGERVVRGGTITLTLSLGPERYPVPDLIGKDLELARGELESLRLVLAEGPGRFDNNLPQGVVVAVEPPVGQSVRPGTTVTVTVSKGKAPITVPTVLGRNINEARAILQQLGLVPVERYTQSDRPKDEVIAQDPGEGAGAERGNEVQLEVSQGPPLVTVPRVVDQPCQQAKQTLEAMGLPVDIQLNPEGVVRFQNPGENTQVPPQTRVTIGCF